MRYPPGGSSLGVIVLVIAGAAAALLGACGGYSNRDDQVQIAEGRRIFRFETVGDVTKWTDMLRVHEAIRTSVDPTTALSVGLKVDAQAMSAATGDRQDPATTDLSAFTTTSSPDRSLMTCS